MPTRFFKNEQNLEFVSLSIPSKGASCTVALYGAHITSWITEKTREHLFMSKTAVLDGSKGIRGGIPVVFPQFGPGELPQHGFARTSTWSFEGTNIDKDDECVQVQLGLNQDAVAEDMKAKWPYKFHLTLQITLYANNQLHAKLAVINNDTRKFSFTCLLHPYFAVPEIETLGVSNLKGLPYFDKVLASNGESNTESTETRDLVTFSGEVDRVYRSIGPHHEFSLRDTRVNSEILVIRNGAFANAENGFKDVVVWNPSLAKAPSMKDLHEGGWHNFVCVELGHVSNPVTLNPNESFEAIQELIC